MNTNEILALIEANRAQILDEIRDCYARYIRSEGRADYVIYIWSDGEIDTLERVGRSGYYRAYEWEPRELIHVCCVGGDHYDWVDYCSDPLPEEPDWRDYDDDDEAGYEAAKSAWESEIDRIHAEVDDWMISEFDPEEILEDAIRDIEENGDYPDD